jgi:hypothetical protein
MTCLHSPVQPFLEAAAQWEEKQEKQKTNLPTPKRSKAS